LLKVRVRYPSGMGTVVEELGADSRVRWDDGGIMWVMKKRALEIRRWADQADMSAGKGVTRG
jgi:hypothetical protein